MYFGSISSLPAISLSDEAWTQLIAYGAVVVVLTGMYLTRRWARRSAMNAAGDMPVLMSDGLLADKKLHSVQQDTISYYSYNLLVNGRGQVMMFVTLPKNTSVHIIAVGDKSGRSATNRQLAHSKWLERVSLEGGFPDYFRMFCSKDKQLEVRQVFDPEIMQNFLEFCRAYNFELFNESVYVSVAQGSHDKNDNTAMVTDVMDFLRENQRLFDAF
jgi:hypothetical protein